MALMLEGAPEVLSRPLGGRTRGSVRGVERSSNVQPSSASITASANPMDETCPSPMHRKAMATRSSFGPSPSCEVCSTALGLQRAAPSTAYSAVKAAPSTAP